MIVTLAAFLCAFHLSPANADDSKEVRVGVADAYIPSGFDSKSETFVVVNGVFPNSCYRWSRADVRSPSEFTHEVQAYAMVKPGMCLMVLVPYTKEIHLGLLPSGTHVIRFLSGDGTYFERSMKVE